MKQRLVVIFTLMVCAALLILPPAPGASARGSGRAGGQVGPKASLVLILVLDRSGSMSGGKMQALKAAVLDIVRRLRPQDRVGIVQFDSRSSVVWALARVATRTAALAAVRRMTAGGGTDFAPALLSAGQMLSRLSRTDKSRRHVLFISDGQSSRTGVMAAIRKLRSQSATLSAIALGEGADRAYLQSMATVGKGRMYNARATQRLQPACRRELKRLSR